MADTAKLKQALPALSKCGRPIMPSGVTCLDLEKRYYYQKYFPFPTDSPPYPPDTNEAIEIRGDTTFMLKALSGLNINATQPLSLGLIYCQIQYPSGRFLQNRLADLNPIAGSGSGRLAFAPAVACPPGSKIFLTLDGSIAGASGDLGAVVIMCAFEGGLRFFLPAIPGVKTFSPADSAAKLPRYFKTPNQNILAPEWMVSGLDGTECPSTPSGESDFGYTYSSTNNPAVISEAGPVATTIEIQIDRDTDFLCGRIMFGLVVGNVAPTLFARIRTSLGGSALCDDYIPVNTADNSLLTPGVLGVANNMTLPKDWYLKAGVTVFIDVFGITNGGDSDTTLIVYLEGAKRRLW